MWRPIDPAASIVAIPSPGAERRLSYLRMNPLQYLLHLWAVPPQAEPLVCPPAPEGVVANATGSFNYASVSAAYATTAAVSVFLVILVLSVCYLATRLSTGPRFDRRFLFSWVITTVLCGVIPFLVLTFAPTTAEAGTCQSNPSAFPATLPMGVIISRGMAGLVWGALAFLIFSVLATKIFGNFPSLKNGFYHNRGTPWPRFMGGK
jgi:hypothetical protein